MKRILKRTLLTIIIIILIITAIIFAYRLFGKTGYINTKKSENYLHDKSYILDRIGINTENCGYWGPSTFPVTRNPEMSCKSKLYQEEEILGKVTADKNILESDGWTASQYNHLSEVKTTYYKNDLRISIEPYYWGRNAEEIDKKQVRLIVNFQHLTLSDFSFDSRTK